MAKTTKQEKPTVQDDIQTALLLKEADEALRQERLEALWKEWGSTVIGVALMVIFGTMIGVGWKTWRTSVHKEETAKIVTANEQGITGLMGKQDEFSSHYGGIVSLLAASDLITKAEDQTASLAPIIHDVMVDADAAGLPRQYDILAQWGALRTKADVEQSADIKLSVADEMMDLSSKRGNPYRPLIMTEAAAIYGENGNASKAVEILKDVEGLKLAQENAGLYAMVKQLKRLYEKNLTAQQGQ